ncbi:uncharacterized protein KGF55_002901 [Candida pseudojiufengensis]|uniref:uncharacterized protein n=1 Tax=Candida pseudojiufengensis TaxID=497109 RepID=UPI002225AD90|nr:uncharacterized protein KGF55_002901 [Candida pseudojiufengensis]KAI5963109.1 hypothetical protein KGF55_002901 [Candida pseudojiufengensis]
MTSTKFDPNYIELDNNPPIYDEQIQENGLNLKNNISLENQTLKTTDTSGSPTTTTSNFSKALYATFVGIFLFCLSMPLIFQKGNLKYFGIFSLPFSIYFLIIINGFIAFGVENNLGTSNFYKLLRKSFSITFGISLVITFSLFFAFPNAI